MPEIELRIQQIEKFIENIAPYKTSIGLVILKNKPNYFRIVNNIIYIGEPLLETPGHLEKALLKIWYRENSQNMFAYENLLEEVYTDFVLYIIKGNLEIEDPFHGLRTRIGGSRWPQVLKSIPSYCQSPWKSSEHYQLCSQIPLQYNFNKNEILEMSLRPLLVSSWIQSYQDLGFREQYEFVTNLRELISADHNPDLPIVKTNTSSSEETPLLGAAEAVKSMGGFLMSSNLTKISDSYRVFVTLVANNLIRNGYKDSLSGVDFDLLVISEDAINSASEQFTHYLTLSKQNPNMKIAIKDSENLWMLPSIYPIHWKSIESLHSNRVIYSKCGAYDFNFVWKFSLITEKLMILNVCKDQKLNLMGYLKEGPEAFGEQNKNIPFIQFHIPSLLMRKDQLSHVENIYDLVSRREIDNPVFQSLGWQKLMWSEKAQAYQPKSYIDGIEWFKVQ
ncbi:MAG: hypothetical protein ACXWRA_10900 [Pseudobdellovibrionaceae bacterium]